jgi:hypothetical protein
MTHATKHLSLIHGLGQRIGRRKRNGTRSAKENAMPMMIPLTKSYLHRYFAKSV